LNRYSVVLDEGTPLKKELNKSPSVLSPIEGDPDFRNDRSRILISQRTNVDGKFGLAEYNTAADFSSDTTGGDAAIVIKSDKVRLIARSDLEMVVTNYTVEEIPDRLARKDEEANLDSWASIVIKSTGDIILRNWNPRVDLTFPGTPDGEASDVVLPLGPSRRSIIN
jgi:hypothetical protein